MKTILPALLLFLAAHVFAQNKFIASISYNNFSSVVQSPDGNYIAVGSSLYEFDTNNQVDMIVAKLDNTGQLIWSKIFNISNGASGTSIINTNDKGFAIAGSATHHSGEGIATNESNISKMTLYKFNASGDLQWMKEYDSTIGSAGAQLLQTADNGFMISGYIAIGEPGDYQPLIVRTDSLGNIRWAKKYFAFGNIADLQKTNDNNYIFAGSITSYGGVFDSASTVKIDSNGNVLWAKNFYSENGGITFAWAGKLLPVSDDGYIITGRDYSRGGAGFILKLDATGDKVWSKLVWSFVPYGTLQSKDGDYLVYGEHGALAKINSSGSVIWSKASYNGDIKSIINTADGGYIGVGSLNFDDGLLIKYDSALNSCLFGDIDVPLEDFGVLQTITVPVTAANIEVTSDVPTIVQKGTLTNICSVLPLQLLSFNAMLQNKTVQLNWTTAQEVNTAYFSVEKSSNGRVFNSFAQVSAGGVNNKLNNYSLTDLQPLPGRSFYRLKMMDKDGQYTYSNIASVNYDLKERIAISPNPVEAQLNLNIKSLTAADITIQLFDINGRLLTQKTKAIIAGSNIVPFDVTKYSSGIYTVKIIKNDDIQSIKWIKK